MPISRRRRAEYRICELNRARTQARLRTGRRQFLGGAFPIKRVGDCIEGTIADARLTDAHEISVRVQMQTAREYRRHDRRRVPPCKAPCMTTPGSNNGVDAVVPSIADDG
jgi:hypothetical protein